jgi:glycerol-3-phosphate dehydrogenase
VTLQETENCRTFSINAPAVVNATGCWAETLHPQHDGKRHLRPLRGSHLIFPSQVLPVQCAVSCTHPEDGRAVFIIPWEGVVLVGTTDLDHDGALSVEPRISDAEADYLLAAVRTLFPSLGLSLNKCISSLAGLRPIISSGDHKAPSEESREHDIWVDKGLVTIAGGKLTTYRRVTLDALKALQPFLPPVERPAPDSPGFTVSEPLPPGPGMAPETWQRLCGRYGGGALAIAAATQPDELQCIPGTQTLWAELPYAAAHESVRHLADLMLRRVRIGLLLPEGGSAQLSRIEALCRPVLGWDKRRWRQETRDYLRQWRAAHGFAWQVRPLGRLARVWHWLQHQWDRLVDRWPVLAERGLRIGRTGS